MTNRFWEELSVAVFGEAAASFQRTGSGHLPSFYAVSDFADASIGLAGAALARLGGCESDTVRVDRRLASLWFDMTLRPDGWQAPSLWDDIAGDYRCKDGWIRLHTNAPHHRAAVLSVLKGSVDRAAVGEALLEWSGKDLEEAIVAAGGCAAQMRLPGEWAMHPQGKAIAKEPLIAWSDHGRCEQRPLPRGASLKGIKVLDLTRVLAGPVATRFLAGFGADVLRIDPPWWNEPSVEMEVTLGKRCAGLDLRKESDLAQVKKLMGEADVFVHGYRTDALERIGLGDDVRRALNPALIDVRLNAYGWSGPWTGRRGFDSLVQMSCGIAALGMKEAGADRPKPLPVQALDHATGYLMAACVLEALKARAEGQVRSAKLSLARTAHTLMAHRTAYELDGAIETAPDDFGVHVEQTGWGPAHRIKAPVSVCGAAPVWPVGAGPLRGDPARFASS
ncbi:CoA transferase [Planktotalea sp.]|uniref:CoA transferase n=1 Tax=Planktotalea sp. TaxID=2029877 RepID=UPI003D6C3A34